MRFLLVWLIGCLGACSLGSFDPGPRDMTVSSDASGLDFTSGAIDAGIDSVLPADSAVSGDAGRCGSGCDDSNPCTLDVCDPVRGCQYTMLTGACEDGSECTKNDVCEDGRCKSGAINCADSDTCTADSCVAGKCKHAVMGDGLQCGDVMVSFGSCESTTECSYAGTQAVFTETPRCAAGMCTGDRVTSSQACTVNTDGLGCQGGSSSSPPFCSCAGVAGGTHGNLVRTQTSRMCQAQSCMVQSGDVVIEANSPSCPTC